MTNQMLSFKIYKQKHLMLINHSKTECLSICHLQQHTNRNRFYHGSDMCRIANIGCFFRPWAVFDGPVALESLDVFIQGRGKCRTFCLEGMKSEASNKWFVVAVMACALPKNEKHPSSKRKDSLVLPGRRLASPHQPAPGFGAAMVQVTSSDQGLFKGKAENLLKTLASNITKYPETCT